MQHVHQEKETKFSKTCLYLTFLTQLQTNLLHLKLREVRSPEISVVMSVLNTEKYLTEAIESILQQTFTDFEFIIIDDGSTDKI